MCGVVRDESRPEVQRFLSAQTASLCAVLAAVTLGGMVFAPQITRLIMALSMIGLASSAIISILLLPPRPPNYGRFRTFWMAIQWVLFPINFIVFGAIPALDAQTRLALGAYLGFWVTPKSRDVHPHTHA